jgi:hypothetical protein
MYAVRHRLWPKCIWAKGKNIRLTFNRHKQEKDAYDELSGNPIRGVGE